MKYKIIAFVVYFLPFFFVTQLTLYLLFVVGGLVGMALLILDELVFYQYYNEGQLQEGQVNQSDQLDKNQLKTPFLATRSVLFVASLIPLSFFILTSTGSALGLGLVMSLFLGIILEMWQYRDNQKIFNERFWSLVKKKLDLNQVRAVMISLFAYFLFLSLLFFFA